MAGGRKFGRDEDDGDADDRPGKRRPWIRDSAASTQDASPDEAVRRKDDGSHSDDDASPKNFRKKDQGDRGEGGRHPKGSRAREVDDETLKSGEAAVEYDPFNADNASEEDMTPVRKTRSDQPSLARARSDSPEGADVAVGSGGLDEKDEKRSRASVFSRLGRGGSKEDDAPGTDGAKLHRDEDLKTHGMEADRSKSRGHGKRGRDVVFRNDDEEADRWEVGSKHNELEGRKHVDGESSGKGKGTRKGDEDEASWRDSFKGDRRARADRDERSRGREYERGNDSREKRPRPTGYEQDPPTRGHVRRDTGERRDSLSRGNERVPDNDKPRRSGFGERESGRGDDMRSRRSGLAPIDDAGRSFRDRGGRSDDSSRRPRQSGFDVQELPSARRSPEHRDRSDKDERRRSKDRVGRDERGRGDDHEEDRRMGRGGRYDRSPEGRSPRRERGRGRHEIDEDREDNSSFRRRKDESKFQNSEGERREGGDDASKNPTGTIDQEDAKAKVAKAMAAAAAIAAQVKPLGGQPDGIPAAAMPAATQAALAQAAALHIQSKLAAAGLSGVAIPGQLSSPGINIPAQLASPGAHLPSPSAPVPAAPMTVEVAAALAAKKAAELINKSMGFAGTMSAEEKKKLLWGKKTASSAPAADVTAPPVATPAAAVPSATSEGAEGAVKVAPGGTNHWELAKFGDEATKSKFVKLMGVKAAAAVEASAVTTAAMVPGQGAVIDERTQQVVQEDLEKLYAAGLRRKDGRTVGLGL